MAGWPSKSGSILGKGKRFFFSKKNAQIDCMANLAPYPVGTAGLFPGVKRPGMKVTIHLFLLPALKMRGVVPHVSLWHCA